MAWASDLFAFYISPGNMSSFKGAYPFLYVSGLTATIVSIEKGGSSVKNVEMNVEGNKLIIVVDLNQEFGLSSSGKSITVASTEGNVSVPGREEVKIGLNIYRPRPKG